MEGPGEGPRGTGRRVGVVASRFNPEITDRLVRSALGELGRHGVSETDVVLVRVPGAWELTAACRRVARGGVDGLVALGCVIRGETAHFDHICRSVVQGLTELNARGDVPVSFGVITAYSRPQAVERAGGEVGDLGAEAARALLELLEALDALPPD